MVSKDETYRLLALAFKVYPLYEYAKKHIKPVRFKLKDIAKSYSFESRENGSNTINMFGLDVEHASNLTLADRHQPILVVKLGDESGNAMIDGIHRCYNLWKKGQKTVRGYYLEDKVVISKHSNIADFPLT